MDATANVATPSMLAEITVSSFSIDSVLMSGSHSGGGGTSTLVSLAAAAAAAPLLEP